MRPEVVKLKGGAIGSYHGAAERAFSLCKHLLPRRRACRTAIELLGALPGRQSEAGGQPACSISSPRRRAARSLARRPSRRRAQCGRRRGTRKAAPAREKKTWPPTDTGSPNPMAPPQATAPPPPPAPATPPPTAGAHAASRPGGAHAAFRDRARPPPLPAERYRQRQRSSHPLQRGGRAGRPDSMAGAAGGQPRSAAAARGGSAAGRCWRGRGRERGRRRGDPGNTAASASSTCCGRASIRARWCSSSRRGRLGRHRGGDGARLRGARLPGGRHDTRHYLQKLAAQHDGCALTAGSLENLSKGGAENDSRSRATPTPRWRTCGRRGAGVWRPRAGAAQHVSRRHRPGAVSRPSRRPGALPPAMAWSATAARQEPANWRRRAASSRRG